MNRNGIYRRRRDDKVIARTTWTRLATPTGATLLVTLVAILALIGGVTAPMSAANTVQLETVRLDVDLAHPVMLGPSGPQTAYLRVALTGLDPGGIRTRTPVNVALVLDRSGSMQGEKLREAKRAAVMAVDLLQDEDIVSVVTYESTVHVLVPATRASDRDAIREAIWSIESDGNTALFAGVSKGAAELRKFMARNRVNRVILLSDGLANVGPSTPGLLGNLGASLAREGIAVTTIGLGLQFNEDLMTQLAYQSDGNHFFVENASDLESAWATEFGDVLSVISQGVTIEIRFPAGVRPIRMLGRDAHIDGQTLRASMNHVYVDRTKYLLVELEVPGGRPGRDLEVADIDASFLDNAGVRQNVRGRAAISYTDSAARVEQETRSDVMVEVVRQTAADRNEVAMALRDEGKIEEARSAFASNQAYLHENAELYEDEDLALDAEMQTEAAEGLGKKDWGRARKAQREYQTKVRSQGSRAEKSDD